MFSRSTPTVFRPSVLQKPVSCFPTAPRISKSWLQVPGRRYAYNGRGRPQYNNFQRAGALWKTSPPFRAGVAIAGGGITLWIGSNIEQVPVSGRYRFNCVSEEYEAQLGRMGYQQVMREFGGEIVSPRDPRHKMVGRVLERLLPNSGLTGDLEYHVIEDPDQINAFVIPGGKVFVFSGILPICKNEDGLAAVLGHEIAHNVARHAAEKASLPYLMALVAGIVTFFIDNSAQLTQLVLNLGVELPNSRKQEAEADHLGLLIMAQSCFNPQEAVHLWERMEKANKVAVPQLLSTHPSNQNRIERIQGWLPEAIQRQTESGCGATARFSDQFNETLPSYGGRPALKRTRDDDDWMF